MLYELEYKYNMGTSVPFKGNEQRRDNILKIFGHKLTELIDALTPTFVEVFQEWIDNHDTSDPETMYEKWFPDGDDITAFISVYGRERHGNYDRDKQWQYYHIW